MGPLPVAKTTCAPLFLKLLDLTLKDKAAGLIPDDTAFFGRAFQVGQAEKVYLGSCLAAMSRPGPEYFDCMLLGAMHIADVYGLANGVTHKKGYDDEIWVFRESASALWERMAMTEVDTPLYHRLRAGLCGVPDAEVDLAFHLRKAVILT